MNTTMKPENTLFKMVFPVEGRDECPNPKGYRSSRNDYRWAPDRSWHSEEPPISTCVNGFHGSVFPHQAENAVNSLHLALVEVAGEHEIERDKEAWEYMRLVKVIRFTPAFMHHYANEMFQYAISVLRPVLPANVTATSIIAVMDQYKDVYHLSGDEEAIREKMGLEDDKFQNLFSALAYLRLWLSPYRETDDYSTYARYGNTCASALDPVSKLFGAVATLMYDTKYGKQKNVLGIVLSNLRYYRSGCGLVSTLTEVEQEYAKLNEDTALYDDIIETIGVAIPLARDFQAKYEEIYQFTTKEHHRLIEITTALEEQEKAIHQVLLEYSNKWIIARMIDLPEPDFTEKDTEEKEEETLEDLEQVTSVGDLDDHPF